MNARETYNAISTGNRNDRQHAIFELLSQVQVLSTAVLEIAGERKLRTGKDPLSLRSRLMLSEFIGLPGSKD